MEVILITPNKMYVPLVKPTKIIYNESVDIESILITEVFLNHHYNISFYVLKDNIPNQFQLPVKISKQLLDRNEGPIDLMIEGQNIQMSVKTQSQNELLQIFTKTQFEFYQHKEEKIVYDFRFWELRIKLIMLEGVNQQVFKQYISQNQSSKVHKVILFIDKTNFHYFNNWIEEDEKALTLTSKLSKEYISLKSQIQNEKMLFKNKVKVVEALIGESINVEKLLVEEKEENSQFKRLKETFETIRNIDNVIIEQERGIEVMRKEILEKKTYKQEYRYKMAQQFVQATKELQQIKKQIQLLQYKIKCVEPHINEFKINKIFRPSSTVTNMLKEQISVYKKNFFKKQSTSPQTESKAASKTFHCDTGEKKYGSYLKDKIVNQEDPFYVNKSKIKKEQIEQYECLLRELRKYFQSNTVILKSMRKKIQIYDGPGFNIEDFPILQQLEKNEKMVKRTWKKRNTLEETLIGIMTEHSL